MYPKTFKWMRRVSCPDCGTKRNVEITQTKCKCKQCGKWFKVKH